jgi:hypothetical protein
MAMTHFLTMRVPTMTSAPPVAHDGIDAKIGAKNTETKKARPVTIAVIPVLPPSTVYRLSTGVDLPKNGRGWAYH